MTTLHLEGLVYPARQPVLQVGALDLIAGERVVLFGPNGAGKTTLLRLIAGTIGTATKLDAAYLPQTPYFFRGLAGWNLGLGLDAEGAARARQYSADLGVADLLAEPARYLSGGERQRLALARTLARPDSVVLLDEPLAALDLRDRMSVADVINAAIADRTAVVVTHNRTEAAVLGQRMMVLIGGHVVQDGPVTEVFARPASEEVAAIVGVGNVVAGSVVERGETTTTIGAGDVRISGIGMLDVGHGAKAVFGGETVTIYVNGGVPASSARNTWPGTVTEIRPVGRLVEVIVDVGVPIVALVTPGALEALDVEQGATITLSVKATAVQILPA